ncbi:AraC family ligand binding domain-containing protein [Phyllobacterium salinisoli]|uniref:AraC family ligand binding domain-containing protein n=1 Tax=Phyllobacterium salinisoli TaxID=1899321 RepID=UPI00190FBF78|nr:AraC family ligand binding domain-containing protein [Phyllobacterium salinisoli]
MPWLQPDDEFDPDRMGQAVIGIAAGFGRHDSGWHQHGMGQLLFTRSGCIRISLPNRLCMLPPTRAAWIPPGIQHRARMTEAVDYRSVYLDVSKYSNLPEEVEVMEVTPLLRAVLERIATAVFEMDWEDGAGANLMAVCLDEIHIAHRQPMLLPLSFRWAPCRVQHRRIATPAGRVGKSPGNKRKNHRSDIPA